MEKRVLALAVIIVLVVAVSYIYFGVISPLTAKTALQKPTLTAGQPVESEHVNWVVNEIGGYKLHNSLSGEPAEIEAVVDDKPFSVTTENGKTVTKAGKASNPDIRLKTGRAGLARILGASDIKAEITKLYSEGTVSIELLKDQATLALKGYKAIYDELQSK